MPKQIFKLNNITGQTIEIERATGWTNIIITLNDQVIGRFASWRDLQGGQILKTPIGDVVVDYKRGGLSANGFSVWYDDVLLEGSVDHPSKAWRTGYRIAIGIGIFNLLIGFYFITSLGFNRGGDIIKYQLGFAVVLMFLGFWSRAQRSAIPLGLAALIFAGDGVLGLVLLMRQPGAAGSQFTSGFIGGLAFRAFLVMGIVRGAMAARSMREQPSREKAKRSA